MNRLARVSAAAAALAGLLSLPAAFAQGQSGVSFANYVSVGDSLAAGFTSGSLVDTHQANSVPALLARQAAAQGFEQPTVTEPGLPPELTLVRLVPTPVIQPKATAGGQPSNLNLARPYNNLAVPGATAVDALNTVSDDGGFHDLILRGFGTQVAQAVAARPTFITLWIGNNDVLGAAIRGRAVDGVTLTPTAIFRQVYQDIVNALRTTGARIVAANLPDVTSIPFVTTIPPVVVNPATGQPALVNGQPVPLLGPTGPLPTGTYVTLAASSLLAQGIGIPQALGGQAIQSGGTCQGCLPDEVVLDPAEVASIRDHVAANNRAISEIAAGAAIPVLDVNALLAELAGSGRDIGGTSVSADFLTGGFFSYDGVHPSELGYAIAANEWIRAINATGGTLPLVDLSGFMDVSGAGRAGAASRGRAPGVAFTREAYDALLRAFPEVSAR
jgi:lysophospholipase L1-like esterase